MDDGQLARAAARLASIGSAWDGRLRRIARIAEQLERRKQTERRPDPQPFGWNAQLARISLSARGFGRAPGWPGRGRHHDGMSRLPPTKVEP